MKIALVIERMDISRGGRETSVAQMASALARRGHPVDILCQRASWWCQGVTVRPLACVGVFPSQRLRSFVESVREHAARERYDIVHATLPVPGANVYQPRGGTIPGRQAARLRRRPLAAAFAARLIGPLNLRRRRMAELERQVVADPTVLCLGVSNMVAREFQEHYGRTDRVQVIYNAVDAPDPAGEEWAHHRQKVRFALGVGQKDLVFITVATNFELKGVAQCILAFSKWYHGRGRRTDARLVVVGRDHPENYQRFAGLHDVGRMTVFMPPTQDIFSLYAAADACVLLSWYDPCSRVVLEATRWGIPSITTACNGAAEALADGAGIVVDSPRNLKGVVAAMDTLADAEKRAACSRACLRAAEGLTIERHVDELLAAYQEVARAK